MSFTCSSAGALTCHPCAQLAAKCTVLGNITVGDGAVVGAHTLVTKPVPAGHTAVGVPAKIRPSSSKPKVAPSGQLMPPMPPDAPYGEMGEGL